MAPPRNALRAALAAGRSTRGLWLNLASPLIAEMGGHAGFDWALIDAEHGPNTLATIQAQLQALAATPTPAVVRVPVGEPWVIKQVLDLGVQSVMVPMIETADQAAAVVAATRYPPNGIRGVASGAVRASLWNGIPDYAATADEEICVIVQAETRRALDRIDAIAAVEGVDCVFIGPSDLAADMGHRADPFHPNVRAAIDHMIDRIAAAGCAPGLFGLDPATFDAFAGQGVRMLASASDVTLLSTALRAAAPARPA